MTMLLSRRKLLALSLGSAAMLPLSGLVGSQSVTRRSWALGSEVSMTVVGLSKDQAQRALDAAFLEIELVEQVMSLYRPDSQICRLNRNRVLDQPHPYLIEVLATAEATSRQSQGAFDITVQPLWELYDAAKKDGRLPTADELDVARRSLDWRAVAMASDQVQLKAPVTAITLNGIAQGFAADRAVAALREYGVKQALINTGEVSGLGRKLNGRPWTVGIQHPRERDAFVSLAALEGRSLATSGDYESCFTPDFSTHHVFDPHTGRSPGEVASVSIVAPTAMQADALSTAAMVLGVDRTFTLIESLPSVDALFVLKDGRMRRTAKFPEVEDEGIS